MDIAPDPATPRANGRRPSRAAVFNPTTPTPGIHDTAWLRPGAHVPPGLTHPAGLCGDNVNHLLTPANCPRFAFTHWSSCLAIFSAAPCQLPLLPTDAPAIEAVRSACSCAYRKVARITRSRPHPFEPSASRPFTTNTKVALAASSVSTMDL